jgi:uncharacterized protein (DUF934 family)
MALIKDRKPALDNWHLLEIGAAGVSPPIPETGDIIVPLAVWRESREQLVARNGRLGVWLAGDDAPASIADDLPQFALIAVRFTSFTDGRGYSIGRLLRERYGWRGELRAIGDVQRDQLYYLLRCGFDAFALRDGEDMQTALTAFEDFSEAYQTSVDRAVPLFRRREVAGSLR